MLSENNGAKESARRRRIAQMASMLAAYALIVVPGSWRIAAKAGYRPAFSLLMLLSPLNIIVFVIFSLREWPIERNLRLAQANESTAERSTR